MRQFRQLLDYYCKLGEEKAQFEAELTEEIKNSGHWGTVYLIPIDLSSYPRKIKFPLIFI